MTTFNIYDKFREGNFDGNALNLESLLIKIALVTSSYSVDQNLHDFWDDVVANEVSGTGYTARGKTLANGIVSIDGAGLVLIDFDDPTAWAQSAGGFTNADRGIVFYDSTVDATSRLIGYSASFGPLGNVVAPFSVELDTSGLIRCPR